MIKVHFFAGLKRYFPNHQTIDSESMDSLQDVIQHLKVLQPEASELLDSCRIAVDENFVPLKTVITDVKEVFVIPPSSGG